MRPLKVNARMKHSEDGDPIVTEVELGARGPGQENTVFTILLGVWITALEEESRSRSRPGPGPGRSDVARRGLADGLVDRL